MAISDTPVTCGLLDYINRTANANSEEDLDFLLELMRPTSRNEMSEIYVQALGYNPITYFDEKYLYSIYDDIAATAPDSVQKQLRSKKDEIISKVMDIDANIKEDYLKSLLLQAIQDETGWISGDSAAVRVIRSSDIDDEDYYDDDDGNTGDDEEEEEYEDPDDEDFDDYSSED